VFYIISTVFKNNFIYLVLIFYDNHLYFVIKEDATKFDSTFIDI